MDTIINIILGVLLVVMLILLVIRRKKLKEQDSDQQIMKDESIEKNRKPNFIASQEEKQIVKDTEKKPIGSLLSFGNKKKNKDVQPKENENKKESFEEKNIINKKPIDTVETYQTMLLDQDKTMPLDYKGSPGIDIKLTDIHRNQVIFEKSINQSIVIGRKEGCDIMFDESSISKEHASLSIIEGNVWISDLFSTNGTFVNGTKLSDTTIMNSGDILKVGLRELRVEIG